MQATTLVGWRVWGFVSVVFVACLFFLIKTNVEKFAPEQKFRL